MKPISLKNICTMMMGAALIMLTGSCKKFLDKKQNAKLIVPSTLTDLRTLLDDASTMNLLRTPSYGETSADDYYMTDEYFDLVGSVVGVAYQHFYLWQSYFDPNAQNDWGTAYQPIYNANLALDILKTIPRSQPSVTEWDHIRGAALFFRSYYFLALLWNYSKAYDAANSGTDPGIVLRMTSDFNQKSVRASVEQSYNQVLKDTKEAIRLLPESSAYKIRPTKAAAYGLLARCYLSMRIYDQAYLYSDSCLQFSNELMDYNDENDVNYDDLPFREFNRETIFYSQMNNNGLIFGTGNAVSGIDTLLLDSYSDDDLRKTLFFEPIGYYQIFKGTYTSNIYTCFSGIATDEIYLIRSESAIRIGKIQQGLADLNALLQKRYKTGTFTMPTELDAEQALDYCLNERRKELLMRGLRWSDIKRLNLEGKEIVQKRIIHGKTYTLMPNSDFYALPIPEDIIKLTGMMQN